MKKWIIGWMAVAVATMAAAALPADLEAEARATMAKGAAWLAAQQQTDGHWAAADSPALTGLAMWALQQTDPATYRSAIDRAMVFLLTSVQEDGSIWRQPATQRKGGGLANYNTAVCMTALHALGRPELVPVVQNARPYLAKMQYLDGGSYGGGMGYIDFSGNLDVCITIRTIVKRKNKVYVQAGAGIVADSVPENEYLECMNKAGAVFQALRETTKAR